jgi:hypothetical protein
MPERALLLACLLVTSGAASFACAGAQAAEPVSAPAVSAAPAPPSAPAPRPPAQHPFASTQAETTRLIDVAIDERAADLLSCIDAARPHRKNPHEKVQLEVALDQEGHLLGVKAPAGGSVLPGAGLLPMRVREGFALGACLVLACASWAAGCDPGETECSCRPTGIEVDVCPALTGQVQAFTLTGSACSASTARAIPDASVDGGGTAYSIDPTQPGQCTVEVSFTNGLSFTADGQPNPLTIAPGPGCCTGLYPDPLAAGVIQVCPLAEAGADGEIPDAPAPDS